MKSLFLVIILAIVAGCSSLGIKSDLHKIELSCAAAGATVRVLTAANAEGKLNEAQQDGIGKAIMAVQPICAAEEPPTLGDVQRQAFLQAILVLQAYTSQLEAGK